MGNPKQKWTCEEEEALRAGVRKHGTGKWKLIQRDPEFSHLLFSRSNIDLKDKWRNLTVSATNGVIPRDKWKTQKAKISTDAPTAPVPISKAPASSVPASSIPNDVSMDPVTEDSTKCLLDGKAASKYDAMIYEALSNLNEPNGSDTTTLVNFIELRHEVPQNFRKVITARLRRLVAREKLEKVQNGYRMKKEILQGLNTPFPKPNDAQSQQQLKPHLQPQPQPQPQHRPQLQRQPQPQSQQQLQLHPQPLQVSGYLGDTIEEASAGAAYTIYEAENKSFALAEAVKEAERVARMSEDTDVMLQMAHEIINRSLHGETVLVA